MLIPVNEYLPGTCLPPHLSPFVETNMTSYVPPEKKRLINLKLGIAEPEPTEENKINNDIDKKVKIKVENSQKSDIKKNTEDSDEEESEETNDNGMRVDLESPGEESVDEDTEISESEDETTKSNDVSDKFQTNLIIFFLFCYIKLKTIIIFLRNQKKLPCLKVSHQQLTKVWF